MKHNEAAWKNGLTAWQYGYDDAMYDGFYTPGDMPCTCAACRLEYDRGQQDAMREIFDRKKAG